MPEEGLGNAWTFESSVIMFSDIKDFTLKTSLLTSKQIDEVLSEHEKIVVPAVRIYEGTIIKTMGDAYMVIFKDAEKALKCATEMQIRARTFNKDKKLNLHKIELRISLNYGEVIRKLTVQWEDFFGEAVNMSHRLESITPENKIFVTRELFEKVQGNTNFHFFPLGKTTFKGILREVEIYELVFQEADITLFQEGKLQRENINTGYTSEYASKVKDADEVIFTAASVWGLLGIQPIPFLDTFNLVPIHAYMLIRIANIYGVKLGVDEALDFSKKMITGIWLSYLALQWAIGASKIFLPFVAGYATIPLNFSVTYGLGKIFSSYYYHQMYGIAFSNSDMKDLFSDKRLGGKELGKMKKDEILKKAHESKDAIMNSEVVKTIVDTLKGKKEETISKS